MVFDSIDIAQPLTFSTFFFSAARKKETMQGIDKSQLQRLEQESARFTNEIKQKENENKQLKQEIDKIKRQLKESKKTYDEIAKVSTFKYILIHTLFPSL